MERVSYHVRERTRWKKNWKRSTNHFYLQGLNNLALNGTDKWVTYTNTHSLNISPCNTVWWPLSTLVYFTEQPENDCRIPLQLWGMKQPISRQETVIWNGKSINRKCILGMETNLNKCLRTTFWYWRRLRASLLDMVSWIGDGAVG